MIDTVDCRICGTSVYDDPPSRIAHAEAMHPAESLVARLQEPNKAEEAVGDTPASSRHEDL